MRSTLFFIPHEIGPFTVMGFGWILIFLVIFWGATVGYRRWRGQAWGAAIGDWLTWTVAAAVVIWLLPRIEPSNRDGAGGEYIVGLPIRGYGLMMMLGVMAAVVLCYFRARQYGWSLDRLLSLGFATIASGLVGARVFFVVQKWSDLPGDTWYERLYEALKFTEGGLVVYGCLIGGFMGIATWCWWRKLRLLAVADLVMPGFLIGLAFGRIGCLLNGCCYGGYCQNELPAVTFPKGSFDRVAMPYKDQLDSGALLGVTLNTVREPGFPRKISEIRPGSWAAEQGLRPGDSWIGVDAELTPPSPGRDPAGPPDVSAKVIVDRRSIDATQALPKRSLPTHPTQIYSSINAAVLCGLLFALWPNVRRDGIVFGLGLILYGISRMIEEWIRIDEAGLFGTSLSIAQWISIFGIVGGIAILIIQSQRPAGRFWTANSP